MFSAGDLRSQEREQLKLALVTFALQLDAFEARAKEALKPISKAVGPGLLRTRKDAQNVGR